MRVFSSLVNTCFLFGKSPIAPGTAGSVFAILVWFIFFPALGETGLLFLFLIIILSYFTISFELENTNKKDPQHIVIDEAVGMWLSLLFISFNDYINIALAFILFRLLDILKPSLINRSQSIKGPGGVLMDDIISGVITSLVFLGLVNL